MFLVNGDCSYPSRSALGLDGVQDSTHLRSDGREDGRDAVF